MLGLRGHFLTKSRAYSTTFRAIRGERRTWRLIETLAEIDRATDDPNDIAPDLATITVVNDWAGRRPHRPPQRRRTRRRTRHRRALPRTANHRHREGGMTSTETVTYTVEQVAALLGIAGGVAY